MYRNGSFVELAINKSHNDGQDDMHLAAGTAGMIVQVRRVPEGQEQVYVVDFGAYGQWNCLHNELKGDDDPDLIVNSDGEQRPRVRHTPIAEMFRSLETIPVREGDQLRVGATGIYEEMPSGDDSEEESEDKLLTIDPEEDIARRVKELEAGIQ